MYPRENISDLELVQTVKTMLHNEDLWLDDHCCEDINGNVLTFTKEVAARGVKFCVAAAADAVTPFGAIRLSRLLGISSADPSVPLADDDASCDDLITWNDHHATYEMVIDRLNDAEARLTAATP